MTGTIISNYSTTEVTITSAGGNPVTITDTGTLDVTGQTNPAIEATPSTKISNSGTIIADKGLGEPSIFLHFGGHVTNGSALNTQALISGDIQAYGVHPTVVGNFATLDGSISLHRSSHPHRGTSSVINGNSADTAASITGGIHVDPNYIGTVSVLNAGTIGASGFGSTKIGIVLNGEHSKIINGSENDRAALITGKNLGLVLQGDRERLTNYGTISGGERGVTSGASPGWQTITNGSSLDTSALITGGTWGVAVTRYSSLILNNFGTVDGAVDGILWNSHNVNGGSVVNGSGDDTAASIIGGGSGIHIAAGFHVDIENFATITGHRGIVIGPDAQGSISNSGTISSTEGENGIAVSLGSSLDTLALTPGARIIGRVEGGGGSLSLGSGSGQSPGEIAGIGTPAFADFIALSVSGTWILDGENSVATMESYGTITIGSGGSLDVWGNYYMSSTGHFEISNGATLEWGSLQYVNSAPQIKFLSNGKFVEDHSKYVSILNPDSYGGVPLLENFGGTDRIDLRDVVPANLRLDYTPGYSNAPVGFLQVFNGSTGVASLRFDPSTLGAGTFHATDDGSGGTLITLS